MRAHALGLCLCILALPAWAQLPPALDTLWPNADGLRWDYELTVVNHVLPDESFTVAASLQLSGTVETAGGTAQVLLGDHPVPAKPGTAPGSSPLLCAVWRARPDLRARIAARQGASRVAAAAWWPLLLHPGYFMKSATSIQMWQPDWDHPTWKYLEDDLLVGADFTLQLVPDLADDVFLHGTVEANDTPVTTDAGSFEHAVRMGYRIDYGWSVILDEALNVIGQYRSETLGHVHYVPGVGPVESLEDFIPYQEIDCSPGECPPEYTSQLGVSAETMGLALQGLPTAVAPASWSVVKSLYRD